MRSLSRVRAARRRALTRPLARRATLEMPPPRPAIGPDAPAAPSLGRGARKPLSLGLGLGLPERRPPGAGRGADGARFSVKDAPDDHLSLDEFSVDEDEDEAVADASAAASAAPRPSQPPPAPTSDAAEASSETAALARVPRAARDPAPPAPASIAVLEDARSSAPRDAVDPEDHPSPRRAVRAPPPGARGGTYLRDDPPPPRPAASVAASVAASASSEPRAPPPRLAPPPNPPNPPPNPPTDPPTDPRDAAPPARKKKRSKPKRDKGERSGKRSRRERMRAETDEGGAVRSERGGEGSRSGGGALVAASAAPPDPSDRSDPSDPSAPRASALDSALVAPESPRAREGENPLALAPDVGAAKSRVLVRGSHLLLEPDVAPSPPLSGAAARDWTREGENVLVHLHELQDRADALAHRAAIAAVDAQTCHNELLFLITPKTLLDAEVRRLETRRILDECEAAGLLASEESVSEERDDASDRRGSEGDSFSAGDALLAGAEAGRTRGRVGGGGGALEGEGAGEGDSASPSLAAAARALACAAEAGAEALRRGARACEGTRATLGAEGAPESRGGDAGGDDGGFGR